MKNIVVLIIFSLSKTKEMKKITLLVLLFAGTYTFAQQAPIAIVSTSGATILTSTLDSAAFLAKDNDIIYLPGGSFTGMSTWFTTKVTVIGVGHNPDSTAATGRTEINGTIGFQIGGGEGSVLDGVYVYGDVYISNDIKIYRTNCSGIYPAWSDVNNVLVEKSVIRTRINGQTNVGSIINSKIKNCVISGDFTSYHSGSNFDNCVILTEGNYDMSGANLSTFRNCTFTGITSWTTGHNHFYRNCIFATATLPAITEPSNASNNILGQTAALTFENQSGANYTYYDDYRIKILSLGHNGGTDGTDVGIYGTSSPWLKGSIPPNPHIRTKNVDATTGAGGTLRVRFNVSTQ